MTNKNKTETNALAKTRPALFEVSTLDGGVVVIKPKKVSTLEDGTIVIKPKKVSGSTARLTD